MSSVRRYGLIFVVITIYANTSVRIVILIRRQVDLVVRAHDQQTLLGTDRRVVLARLCAGGAGVRGPCAYARACAGGTSRGAALAKGALPKDPERCRLPVLDHLGASGLATYDVVLSRTCGAIGVLNSALGCYMQWPAAPAPAAKTLKAA